MAVIDTSLKKDPVNVAPTKSVDPVIVKSSQVAAIVKFFKLVFPLRVISFAFPVIVKVSRSVNPVKLRFPLVP